MTRLVFWWALVLLFCNLAIYGVVRAHDAAWAPAGLVNSDLTAVVGDSWAITRDGQVYNYHEPSGNEVHWPYAIELGSWQQVNYGQPGRVLTWGQLDRGDLIVATENAIWIGQKPIRIIRPLLEKPIIALGSIQVCMPDSNHLETEFAASSTQVALYDWTNANWIVKQLAHPITPVAVSYGCRLYYLDGGELGFVAFQIPDAAGIDAFSILEDRAALPQTGSIISVASSQLDLWLLSDANEIFELVNIENSATSWHKLPSPPLLSHPRLVSGLAGPMFGPSNEAIDLWLVADEGAYRFNRDTLDWKVFPLPPEVPAITLSSLTENSETVGSSVTRLTVSNGQVYRQRPKVMFGTREAWMLVVSCPVTLVLSLVAVGSIMLFARRLAQRV